VSVQRKSSEVHQAVCNRRGVCWETVDHQRWPVQIINHSRSTNWTEHCNLASELSSVNWTHFLQKATKTHSLIYSFIVLVKTNGTCHAVLFAVIAFSFVTICQIKLFSFYNLLYIIIAQHVSIATVALSFCTQATLICCQTCRYFLSIIGDVKLFYGEIRICYQISYPHFRQIAIRIFYVSIKLYQTASLLERYFMERWHAVAWWCALRTYDNFSITAATRKLKLWLVRNLRQ